MVFELRNAGIAETQRAIDALLAEIEAAEVDLGAIGEDLLPTIDDTYDLGSATKRWNEGFFGNLLRMGATNGKKVELTNGNAVLEAEPATSDILTQEPGQFVIKSKYWTGAESAILSASLAMNILDNNPLAWQIYLLGPAGEVFRATDLGNFHLDGLPTADPAVFGALWVDVAANRVVKQSAG